MMDIEECIKAGFLLKEKPSKDLIDKERKEAQYDLSRAKIALNEKDYKWAIVKSYYAMFHIGKAVCFKEGLREKKHVAVLIVLEHLAREGKIETHIINDFRAAMAAREGADYRYAYTKEQAEQVVNIAIEFIASMQKFASLS